MVSDSSDIKITYPVERSIVERATEMLGKQRHRTNGFRKLLFWSGVVFASTLTVLALTSVIYIGSESTSFASFSAGLFGFHMLAALALAIAFLACLPQAGFEWWFLRRIRETGLSELALLPPSTWRRRILRLFGPVLGILGVLLLTMVGLALHISFVRTDTGGGEISDLYVSLIFLVIGVLLTAPPFIARNRESQDLIRRIDELDERLSAALTETESGSTVVVRAQDLNVMARMEQARIEAERREAVTRARREDRPDDLVLLSSKDALAGIRELAGDARIHVQEQAAALTQHAEPPSAEFDEASGLWSIVVPDTRISLNYSIDREKHEVNLVSVSRLDDDRHYPGAERAVWQ
jgi:hypothetical protein